MNDKNKGLIMPTWEDNQTPVNAANLNSMVQSIKQNSNDIKILSQAMSLLNDSKLDKVELQDNILKFYAKEVVKFSISIPTGSGEIGIPGQDGRDGREIELRKGETHIEWNYVGEDNWKHLVSLEELKGQKGQDGQKGADGTPGRDGQDGANGKEIELRKGENHIEWKYVGEESWKHLIALEDLKGQDGIPGTNGQDGESPNLEIGNVSTLEPGSRATANVRLISENRYAIDLGIPRGAKGQDGTGGGSGSTVNPTLEIGSVTSGEVASAEIVGDSPNYTINLVLPKGEKGEKGLTGEQGPRGEQGEKGNDGVTPNITIGEVTTLEAGQQATVTNSGTKEEPIFNFGIPRGQDGVNGDDSSIDLSSYQLKQDEALNTIDKTVVGAINEIASDTSQITDKLKDNLITLSKKSLLSYRDEYNIAVLKGSARPIFHICIDVENYIGESISIDYSLYFNVSNNYKELYNQGFYQRDDILESGATFDFKKIEPPIQMNQHGSGSININVTRKYISFYLGINCNQAITTEPIENINLKYSFNINSSPVSTTLLPITLSGAYVYEINSADNEEPVNKTYLNGKNVLIENELLPNILNKPNKSSWFGKKYLSLGDSITWQHGNAYGSGNSDETGQIAKGYQQVLVDELGVVLDNTYSRSGETIGKRTDDNTGFVTRMTSINYTNFELITIAYGTNDKVRIPLGELGNREDSSFDETTFYGAYRKVIEHILTQNPTVTLVLMTPLQTTSDSLQTITQKHVIDYANAIIDIATMYGLPVCDLYRNSGINKITGNHYLYDGLHPKSIGHKRNGKILCETIKRI